MHLSISRTNLANLAFVSSVFEPSCAATVFESFRFLYFFSNASYLSCKLFNSCSRSVKRSLNILRIGTSGAIQPEIPLGSFVFSDISIGCDGLLNWYADRDAIALGDFEEAFKAHTGWDRHLPDPYFVRAGKRMTDLFADCALHGMTVSASGFYGPQGRVLRMPLAMPDMLSRFESFSFGGYKVTNFEMEGSAIAGIAAHLGHNAGTVCAIIAHRYLKSSNPDYKPVVRNLVKLCLDRMSAL